MEKKKIGSKKMVADFIPKQSYILMPKKPNSPWIYFSKEKV